MTAARGKERGERREESVSTGPQHGAKERGERRIAEREHRAAARG